MEDGSEKFVQGAELREIEAALKAPKVRSIHIYKPGSTVQMSDRDYRVDEHGCLRRINRPRRRKRR
jgi:hypothetical protein